MRRTTKNHNFRRDNSNEIIKKSRLVIEFNHMHHFLTSISSLLIITIIKSQPLLTSVKAPPIISNLYRNKSYSYGTRRT